MRRPAALLILALYILLCPARRAEAQAQARARPIFERIPICTPLPAPPPRNGKPPGKPLKRWAFGHSGDLITEDDMLFTVLTAGLSIYVYEPHAPPGNLRLLPMRYKGLECPPYVPPPPNVFVEKPEPKPAVAKDERKDDAPPKANPEPERDEYGYIIPPGVRDKRLPERPPEKPRPSPPPPEGVLSNAPLLPASTGILREESVLPSRDEVSPPKYVDEEQTLVDRGGTLPELQHRPGRPLVSVVPCKEIKGGCKGEGNGDGNGAGKPKTRLEEIALEFTIAAAIANGELNEDLKRKDGKAGGIVGGKNLDGIDHPILQAAVATATLASAVLVGQASKFVKKLEEACAKKAPLIIQGTEELSKETAELLAKQYGEHIAHARAQNQTVGPYKLMSQFTDGMKGRYETHHILEVNQAIMRELTKELDKIPSVILTVAEHRRFNKMLSQARPNIHSVDDLWKLYESAYKDSPHWLDAIKPYFGK